MHLRRPKWLRLKRTQQRRIEKLLKCFPHTEPEITVHPYDGEPFEVTVPGAPEHFVPLEIGAEEVYADYDAQSRAFEEANHLWVARRVRVHGVWCFDVYETGGDLIDGCFEVIWRHAQCKRVGRDTIRSFDSGNREEIDRFPRWLGLSVDVRWTDGVVEGPDLGVAGYTTVDVAGRSFECMCVVKVERFDEDLYDGGPWLRTLYFTRAGRLILSRTYLSRKDLLREIERSERYEKGFEPTGIGGVTWNGLEFVHWYDRLSGLALGINPRTT